MKRLISMCIVASLGLASPVLACSLNEYAAMYRHNSTTYVVSTEGKVYYQVGSHPISASWQVAIDFQGSLSSNTVVDLIVTGNGEGGSGSVSYAVLESDGFLTVAYPPSYIPVPIGCVENVVSGVTVEPSTWSSIKARPRRK